MKIQKNSVVELTYELEVDGQIADRCPVERPLDYIHGTGSLLPKFEEYLEGLEPGDNFKFTLSPDEGYGRRDPNRVIELPKEAFMVNGEMRDDLMKPGTTIPLLNQAGQVVPGLVVSVNEATVTIDVNSPMADKTLNFSGSILSVREATEKELSEGLHGEYVHSNCGCGGCGGHHGEGHECGGCGGDCGEGGCHDGGCGGHGEGQGCGNHGKGHGEGHGCSGHGKGHGEGGCCHSKE